MYVYMYMTIWVGSRQKVEIHVKIRSPLQKNYIYVGLRPIQEKGI